VDVICRTSYHDLDRPFLILSVGIAPFILIPGQGLRPDDPIPLPERIAPAVAALAQAVAAKDRKAYEHLFQDGRAFLVTDRVRVLVISLQGDSAKVKFLDGYHSGKSGFVIREWLKLTP
jgi:hypothetical protein